VGPNRILSIAFVIALGTTSAFSPRVDATPPEGKGKPDASSTYSNTDAAQLISPVLDYDHIRGIAVSTHQTGYKALPPGIAKNLARGKPLPPGIAKKSLPAPMLRELPTYPDYEWKRCGADLVLVQIATQVVAEVLANVFR
jgi:hypothetical protein